MPDMPNLAKWLHHSASAVFRLDQEGPLDPRWTAATNSRSLMYWLNSNTWRRTPSFASGSPTDRCT